MLNNRQYLTNIQSVICQCAYGGKTEIEEYES